MIEDAKVSSSVSSNGSVKVHAHESDGLFMDAFSFIESISKKPSKKLKAKKKSNKAKAAFYDHFASSKIIMSIDDFVKILESADVHTGRNKVLETLRNEGYLQHDKYGKNQPTSKSTGLFEYKKNAKKSMILMLTAKGVIDLYDHFTKEK